MSNYPYYNKLKQVVDYYNTYPQNIGNPHAVYPVTATMFDDSNNEKLNNGDVVYDSVKKQFAIVTGSGQGRVLLSIISQTENNSLQQIGSYSPGQLYNFNKVIHRTTGGKSRKSKKSRKTIKSKKSRKSRKSRKM